MIYISWDTEQNIPKLVTLGHFLPFYPSKKPQNQNFEKWKNFLELYHFPNMYQKPQYMIYGSWDTEWDRHNSLSYWAIFCPFTNTSPPQWYQKSKFWEKKKWKKCLDILFFYTYMCTINEDHTIYMNSMEMSTTPLILKFWKMVKIWFQFDQTRPKLLK